MNLQDSTEGTTEQHGLGLSPGLVKTRTGLKLVVRPIVNLRDSTEQQKNKVEVRGVQTFQTEGHVL